jgi:hypothetical protein
MNPKPPGTRKAESPRAQEVTPKEPESGEFPAYIRAKGTRLGNGPTISKEAEAPARGPIQKPVQGQIPD